MCLWMNLLYEQSHKQAMKIKTVKNIFANLKELQARPQSGFTESWAAGGVWCSEQGFRRENQREIILNIFWDTKDSSKFLC